MGGAMTTRLLSVSTCGRPDSGWRRVLCVAAVCAAIATFVVLVVATPAANAAEPGPICGATAPSEIGARAMAVACGQRVEVLAERSERSQTFAEPDGTMTSETTAVAQRVRKPDGSWTAIDRTLHRLPDGTVVPTATGADLTFSGGGAGPLASWRRGGHLFTLTWPTPLPAPVLEGGSATYSSVLDGVDIVVTATDNGFRHVLVVHGPEAAANPQIRDIHYRLAGDVSASVVGDGGIELRSPDGKLFAAAPKGVLMWDSGVSTPGLERAAGARPLDVDPIGPRSDSQAPAAGADVREVSAVAVGGELVMRPTLESLSGPTVDYPLYIDPDFDAGTGEWAYSNSSNINWPLTDGNVTAGEPGGNQLWVGLDPDFNRVYRGYLRFGVGGVGSKHILNAKVDALVDHTYHCSGFQNVYLYASGLAFGANGSRVTHVANHLDGALLDFHSTPSANEASCPHGNHEFSWSGGLTSLLQAVADQSGQGITFIISAASNTDAAGESITERWMRFALGAFRLIVSYNSRPTLGALSTTPATPCVNLDSGPSPSRPYVSTTPTLRAVADDLDVGETALRTVFEWQPWAGTAWGVTSSGQQSNVPRGNTGQVTPPTLPDGVYRWRVQVFDPWDVSAWSGWCQFEKDATDPAVPIPGSPTDLPAGCTCGSIGMTQRLTFSSSTDVVSFRWGPTNPPTNTATAPSMGSATTISWTIDGAGPRAIYVQAVDRAGNLSGLYTHRFTVTPPSPNVGRWLQLDRFGALNLNDSSGSANPHSLTLAAGNQAAAGRVVGEPALGLLGTAGQYATTSAVLDSTQSFAVSAWVRLTSAPTSSYFPTVLSQSNGSYSAIELQAQPGGWCLNARDLGGTPAISSAVCGGTVALNTWTHVAAVYDRASGSLRVYVNGVKVADAGHVPPSASSGSLGVGRSTLASAAAELFAGDLSDVRVWQRPLFDSEIAAIVEPPIVGKWRFGEVEPPEFDESGHLNHLSFTGPGASVPTPAQGIDGTGLVVDGTASAFSDNPVVRTDQSFTISAWVRPTDLSADFGVVASQDGTLWAGFYLEYIKADNAWSFTTISSDTHTGTWRYAESFGTPAVGRWTHLVGVYDAPAKQTRIYVNGVLGSLVANNMTNWNATGAFRIGEANDGGGFVGAIDEVRVYAGVVPVWKGNWDFGACTGTPLTCADAAAVAHPVQLAGGAVQTATGKYGSGLTLPTAGGATATGPVMDTTKSYTVSAWVKLTSTSAKQVAISQSGTNRAAFELGYQASTSNNFCFIVYDADLLDATSAQACGTRSVPLNQWVHVAGSYDAIAGTVTLHINGGAQVPDGQTSVTAFNRSWPSTGPLAIGRSGSAAVPSSPWLGDIDEVIVHQGVISELSLTMS
jgi:hypothetical protein